MLQGLGVAIGYQCARTVSCPRALSQLGTLLAAGGDLGTMGATLQDLACNDEYTMILSGSVCVLDCVLNCLTR